MSDSDPMPFDDGQTQLYRAPRRPILDWRLNISNMLALAGVAVACLTYIFAIDHRVDINKQEHEADVRDLRAAILQSNTSILGRIDLIKQNADTRTVERQEADAALRQQLRDLEQSDIEIRRLLNAHINEDRKLR